MSTTQTHRSGALPQSPAFIDLDRGPWRYSSDSPAVPSGHKHFVESDDFPDVRLYINGNFGDDVERAAYGEALAVALNSVRAAVEHIDVARIAQRQLDALKSLAMMAGSFATELSKDHPDVVEALAALAAAKDLPPATFSLAGAKATPSKITPFEERLTPGAPLNSEIREQAMLAEIAEWRALAESRAKADTLTRGNDGNFNTGPCRPGPAAGPD